MVVLVDSGAGQEGVLQDTGVEVLHLLLTQLGGGTSQRNKDKFGVTPEQTQAFLTILRKGGSHCLTTLLL